MRIPGARTRLLLVGLILLLAPGAARGPTWAGSAAGAVSPAAAAGGGSPVASETATVKLGGRRMTVDLVRVKLADPGVEVRVALAQDRVGGTEELLDLARRKGAVAAINGTFFEAYIDGEIKDPLGTIITEGELVHKGDVGTVFAITASKEVRMEPVRFKIVGIAEGPYEGPHDWYAYWINHAPRTTTTDHAAIYTPARGHITGVVGGTSVLVQQGRVTRIASGNQVIPKDGYVLNFQGSELALADRFRIGTLVECRVTFQDDSPLSGFWVEAEEGLGAGPKLVGNGKVVFSTESARAEGFTEAGILSASSARSALGINAGGELLMVTVAKATVAELARAMQSLGAVEAMNLDGGSSSGLVYRGKYITRPGRKISNALLVFVSK